MEPNMGIFFGRVFDFPYRMNINGQPALFSAVNSSVFKRILRTWWQPHSGYHLYNYGSYIHFIHLWTCRRRATWAFHQDVADDRDDPDDAGNQKKHWWEKLVAGIPIDIQYIIYVNIYIYIYIIYIYYYSNLAGGLNLPLWKMMESVSWDCDIPNWMESHKIHVPNQPENDFKHVRWYIAWTQLQKHGTMH